jgi:catechol 2,3-dioxygenase-like lactoylglutathione lyase family enzyme
MTGIRRIDAVTLATHDMAASIAFYTALGFDISFGGPTSNFTTMSAHACHVNLTLEGTVCPWGRVVFHVDDVDDVDALHATAVAAGLEPDTSPADAAWGERYFAIHDPAGHDLSFARPL